MKLHAPHGLLRGNTHFTIRRERPRALQITIADLDRRNHEIPPDREIVLYCSCPSEVSAARVAPALKRKGLARVRPLLGGITAWQARNFPVESPSLENWGL